MNKKSSFLMVKSKILLRIRELQIAKKKKILLWKTFVQGMVLRNKNLKKSYKKILILKKMRILNFHINVHNQQSHKFLNFIILDKSQYKKLSRKSINSILLMGNKLNHKKIAHLNLTRKVRKVKKQNSSKLFLLRIKIAKEMIQMMM